MTVTIYHNPACGTSRRALALIRASGEDPVVVDYLREPPTPERLGRLIADMGTTPRDLLRRKEPLHAELGLDDPSLPDDRLLDALLAHPVLMERPIVETPKGTRLCRPTELVLGLLDAPVAETTREDGGAVRRAP